jgi:glutamyl-tRNA synthetase/glutamyl-Q tRNA(Asp) synthetase
MRTRFAPAPTGWLHLGHVANALYVWGLAARFGADLLLRIEDHDRQRSRREYESALLDDLDWLGFVPTLFPTDAFRSGTCESRQSDRTAIYAEHASALIARGLIYGCTCSRQQVMTTSGRDARVYPGTCRDRGIAPAQGVTWRVRIAAGSETFDDALAGPHTQNPSSDSGDVVIRDRHGNWTYQFCVVVDDFLQEIDLVVRGEDLLSSTGLQIALARLLGRPAPPRFAHHPLIMKSADQKLSKSDNDTGIRDLRAAGWRAEDVIGAAAQRVGLTEPAGPVAARDAARLFGSGDLTRSHSK